MNSTETKNIFNMVGFRIFNPFTTLPLLPAQNHIGSHLLFYAVQQALETRGLLIAPGCMAGELNRSNYFFMVNHLANSLKTLDEVLTGTTLRCLATLVYYNADETAFYIHGPNPAGITAAAPYDLGEMQKDNDALQAMLAEIKKLPIIPPPATDNQS